MAAVVAAVVVDWVVVGATVVVTTHLMKLFLWLWLGVFVYNLVIIRIDLFQIPGQCPT